MSSHVEDVYLELVEGVGLESAFRRELSGLEVPNPRAGEPAPLSEIRFQIPIPVELPNGDVGTTTTSAVAQQLDNIADSGLLRTRIIPGTRIVHTQAPAVVEVLQQTGHYRQCDPPTSEQPRGDGGGLSSMKKADLEALAAERGVQVEPGATRAQIAAAIDERAAQVEREAAEAAAEAQAAAEQAAANAGGEPGDPAAAGDGNGDETGGAPSEEV